MAKLSALYCYPVKSCRGIALQEAALDARGIVHDREFLIVDEQDHCVTQRTVPALALIETVLTPAALVLRGGTGPELTIPWEPVSQGGDTIQRKITIWQDSLMAEDMGDDAAAWLTALLGQRCRLVRMGPGSQRKIPAQRIPSGFPAGGMAEREVSFPDAYPLLVISEESLTELNGRLEGCPVPMDRFRPNLVLSGCERPHEEDDWRVYRIGDATLWSVKPCERCKVPTIDQFTLAQGGEPLRTLSDYRRSPEGKVVFGQNVIHENPGDRLRVGDAVQLLA